MSKALDTAKALCAAGFGKEKGGSGDKGDDGKGQAPTGQGWYGKSTLTKPVGVCTTNVIGSHVIFACDKGVIQEHVYIENLDGKAPKTPDCSGPKKYVMPIENGCNNYNWGSMYMSWKGFCQVPKNKIGA